MTISLITATFNSASTLNDTIKSVLDQTYSYVEYIIKDGGSTDNTLDIAKEYEQKFSKRLKLLSEKDKGMYEALNIGILMSSGDIIGILNSDDIFTSSDVLEKVAKAFEEDKELDAVYGDVHFVDPLDLNKCVRYYSSKIFKPLLFRFGFMPAHPSFYVRRSCFERFGLYSTNYKIAADFDLLVRFIYKGKIKTKYLPMDFVTMRTGGLSTKNVQSRITLNKEIVRACKKYGIYTNMFLLSLKYLYKIFEIKH